MEFRKLFVYKLAELRERFDVVLFMGMFYHLRDPLLALDLIHEHVALDLLVFQSMQRGSAGNFSLEREYPFLETEIFFKRIIHVFILWRTVMLAILQIDGFLIVHVWKKYYVQLVLEFWKILKKGTSAVLIDC